MAEQDIIDDKLEEMLQILVGNDSTEAGSENCMNFLTLVSKEGYVNETARSKLVALIHDIKDIKMQREKNNRTHPVTKPDEASDAKHAKYTKGYFSKMKMHIFMPIQTTTTKSFESAITQLLSKSSKTNLLYDMSNVQPDAPLVVVCPVSSRIEPDIDMAITGLKWPRRFAVLVLHVVRESSIPRIPSASKLDVDGKYRNIEFIDIAFTPDEGIYTCQMNTNAFDKLLYFIQSLYKE